MSVEQKFIEKVEKEFGVRMEYEPKVNRAVFGTSTSRGPEGGVGEQADALTILAKYDELGGYMTKNGYKIKNGAFFDKTNKVPVKPESLTLLIKVNNDVVEHVEGTDESLELKIAKKQIAERNSKRGRSTKSVEPEVKENTDEEVTA